MWKGEAVSVMENTIENKVAGIVQDILRDYQSDRAIDKIDLFHQPDKEVVIDIVQKLIQIIFPGYYRDKSYRIYHAANHLSTLIEDVMYRLHKQIAIALEFRPEKEKESAVETDKEAEGIAVEFFESIPRVGEYLETDLQAAYDGDPAAYYKDEIILSYPGMFAITVNRIAHELYQLSVPLIPRIMTEYAHSITGIDIHPGASILGGDTVIGRNTVIGSNAFITKSIAEGTRVSIRNQELQFKYDTKIILKKKDLEQDEFWSYSI